MLWAYDDNGYLISVDLPEEGRCKACGAAYTRAISEAKPWQAPVPDRCPRCGHEARTVDGVSFRNVPAG